MANALPSTWRQTTLGEVAAPVPNAIVDGPFGSNLKLSDYVEEGVPVLQGKNITNDSFRWFDVRFVSDRKATELKRSSVRVGDILIIKIGSIGYSAIVEDLNGFEFAIIPANLAKVTPDATKVDSGYLHKWLTSVDAKRYLNSVASKTAQPALSLGKIKSLPLPLPPLAEQRRIAEVLDRAEALRAKRRAALAQLVSLTQSLFLDLFGDPVANPRGWPMQLFGEVCDTRLGKMLDQKQQTGRHLRPYLRNANVQWFSFELADVLEMDFDENARKTFRLKCGDLLICEGGEPGRAAVWRGQIEECYYQKALHRARPRSGLAIPEFLAWQLWFLANRGGLGDHVTSATIAHLTGEKLYAMKIPLPPITLQREFARRVTAVEALKTAQRSSLAELDALSATLQYHAFRGEL